MSTDPSRYVFYADRDVSSFPETVCVRLDRLEMSAKAAWYITRSLRELRAIVGEILPSTSLEQKAAAPRISRK